MPNRVLKDQNYRFGFNGKEADREGQWGSTEHYDYGFRIYDPKLGRFLSVDPLTSSYPWYTPYQFAGNKPIWAVDLDGLEELEIHSAFWTQKLLEMDLFNMTNNEILNEVNRIDTKGYKDYKSMRYAQKYYESNGDILSVTSVEGPLKLTGYTNANSGDIIKFTIYEIAKGEGAIELTFINPEEKDGFIHRAAADAALTWVFKYSGFGKFGRALHNHIDGADPFTGEKASTSELVVGGITDILTMGIGGPSSAFTNISLNALQEAAENLEPKQLEEIGLTREAVDIGLPIFFEKNKVIKTIEVISNMIQAGYITEDVIEKHSEDNEKK